MPVLFRLCSVRTVSANDIASLLQKNPMETEAALRRLAGDARRTAWHRGSPP